MIDLKTSKKSELSFQLNVEGSPQESPRARLVIELQNHSVMAIEGTVLKDKVTIEVPPLKSLREEFLPEKTKCYLEVIIGENYFIPWENELNLREPISVKAEATESSDIKESEDAPTRVSISMDSVAEKIEEEDEKENEEIEKTESPEPNENLENVASKEEEEEEAMEEETMEEGVADQEEDIEDSSNDMVEETNKPYGKEATRNEKKVYTYKEFLTNSVSARDYLDQLFE